MAASAERQMNLAAVQQRDPYISSIVDTASQVALYSFSPQANEWEKTDVEGTLFVYTRSADPVNGFMILNRLGLHDLLEPINKNLEFQLQDPFLLYRNAKASIHGIWFYDKDECARIGQLMNSLVQVSMDTKDPKDSPLARQRRASESDTLPDQRSTARLTSNAGSQRSAEGEPIAAPGAMVSNELRGVDIMQMLSRAQDEYVKAKQPSPRKQSKKSKSKENKGGASVAPPKPMIDNPNASATKASTCTLIRPLALRASPSPVEDSDDDVRNTQNSLEALFRKASLQQNPTTENSATVSTTNSSSTMPSQSLMQRLMSNPGTTLEEIERQQSNTAPSFPSLASYIEPDSPNTALKRSLNMIPSKKENRPNQSLSSFLVKPNGSQSLVTPDALLQATSLSSSQNSLASSVLLAPTAFQGAAASVRGVTPPCGNPFPAKSVSPRSVASDVSPDMHLVNPLTKDQLQQAMIHLLKNDSSFLSSIHEAYVKSLHLSISRSDQS